MSMLDAINNAASLLPDGWVINLCVERGAGWIELHDPDGEKAEFDASPDLDLSDQIYVATCYAIKACLGLNTDG